MSKVNREAREDNVSEDSPLTGTFDNDEPILLSSSTTAVVEDDGSGETLFPAGKIMHFLKEGTEGGSSCCGSATVTKK